MQKIILAYHGPMADVFIDGRPQLQKLQAAFCEAFDVPAPGVFDAEDTSTSFIDFLDSQTVAEIRWLERKTFAAKLNIYLFERQDVAEQLARLASRLAMPVVLDIGRDIEDDAAILFMPEGAVLQGYLRPAAGADGLGELHFSEAKSA